MISVLLTAAMMLAPAPPRACTQSRAILGHEGAPTLVDAYLDPTSPSGLLTVLELRRMVAERPEDVAVRVHLVTTPGTLDPRGEDVRAWVASMTARERLVPALRVVRRDGVDRTYVRLSTPQSRSALAKTVSLPAKVHERSAVQRCHERTIAEDNAELRLRMSKRGTSVFRLPVFTVSDLVFEDSASLERLRPALGRERTRQRHARLRPAAPLPKARATSERLRRPELEGAVLGGVGLRHRFVLMARDEDDPNLFMLLPPVLRFRRKHPGVLTVQIVARGGSFGAQSLRHRLCAARRQGLIAAYVRLLASDPSSRHTDPAVRDLLETLDKVPMEACEDEVDPAELGLPDGGWLDGIPRTRSELEGLATTLDVLETTRRPLTPLLGAKADEL